MSTTPEWKVYEINDCDHWIARSLEEAKRSASSEYGEDADNLENEMVREARELTPEELDNKRYIIDLYLGPESESCSFLEQLENMVRDGIIKPEIFAAAEY